MLIKQNIGLPEFRDWFQGSQYEGNFTYEQLELLYDLLDGITDEDGFSPCGDDITAICCQYSGYDKEGLTLDYGYLVDRLQRPALGSRCLLLWLPESHPTFL